MAKFENSGVLFVNDRKSQPNQPDHTGNIELSRELVKYLAEQLSKGGEAKLSLAAWEKSGGKSGKFLSLSASVPRQKGASQPKSAHDPNDDIPF